MNFKNYFVSAALLAFGMVGCAAHNLAPVAVNAPPPPAAVVAVAPVAPTAPVAVDPTTPKDATVKVAGDNWALTFPDNSWSQVDTPNGVLALVQNDDLQARVMLMGDPFKENTAKLSVTVVTGAKENGAEVVSQTPVTINGNQFIYLNTLLNKNNIFVWLIVKNNVGYVLFCGAQNDPNSEATCNQIASTLHID